jgi:hypothetical protein
MRRHAPKVRADSRQKLLIICGPAGAGKKLRHFGFEPVKAVSQVAAGDIGRVTSFVRQADEGVAQKRAAPRALARVQNVHQAGA